MTLLRSTTGISPATVEKIERERELRPFTDIADFRARVKPSTKDWDLMKNAVGVLPPLFR